MATAALSALRDQTELILSIPSGDAYVDSAQQLRDLNEGYEQTAYRYDWPHLLTRTGIRARANVGRYALPSNFRKAHYIKVLGIEKHETELVLLSKTRNSYTIDKHIYSTTDATADLILKEIPQTDATVYTLSNAESAGAAVTIELDTASGLGQGDEIFIDSTSGTDEFTYVSSVGTNEITARIKYAKSANDVLYRVKEIIDVQYYRTITLLSGSGDATILPDATDFIIPYYAAFLVYSRTEQYTEAERCLNYWQTRLQDIWLAHDKNSTGMVGQFIVG